MDRIGRDRERQPDDDHAAQSLAWDVDAFPEARGAEKQWSLRLLERLEQLAPLAVDTLTEDKNLVEVHPLLQPRVHVTKLAVGREQRERPATDPPSDRGDKLLDGRVKPLVLRQRDVGRQADERLVVEVEWRWKDQLLDLGAESDPRAEVVEGSSDRQRRGREDGGPALRVHALAK